MELLAQIYGSYLNLVYFMMGAAVLASVPVVVLFAFLMDYYIAGLTGGMLR